MLISDLVKEMYDTPQQLSDAKPKTPGTIDLIFGECLEEMAKLKPNSVDMILADTPYNVTACSWDKMLDLDKMWTQIKRIIKPKGAIVLTATQPYTSMLVMSNLKWFKYEWVWDKVGKTGHLNARVMPLKHHEVVLLFSPCGLGQSIYNPQLIEDRYRQKGGKGKNNGVYGKHKVIKVFNSVLYPGSVIRISKGTQKELLHPTQKPVDLGQYLVKTYMDPGQTFLDFTCGSGSFVKAAYLEGMNVIGIDNGYCEQEKEINKIQLKGLSWVEITRLRLENLLP